VRTCGELLMGCNCGGFPSAPRTAAEIEALHHQAVRRAHWSGFADDRKARIWAVEALWPGAWRQEMAA